MPGSETARARRVENVTSIEGLWAICSQLLQGVDVIAEHRIYTWIACICQRPSDSRSTVLLELLHVLLQAGSARLQVPGSSSRCSFAFSSFFFPSRFRVFP